MDIWAILRHCMLEHKPGIPQLREITFDYAISTFLFVTPWKKKEQQTHNERAELPTR